MTTRFKEARRAIALQGALKVAELLIHNQAQDRYHLATAIRAELERSNLNPVEADKAIDLLGRPSYTPARETSVGAAAAVEHFKRTLETRERNTLTSDDEDVHELVAEIADLDARVHSHARRLELVEAGREALQIANEKLRADLATAVDRLYQVERTIHGRMGELAGAVAEAVETIGDEKAEAAYLNAVVEGSEPIPTTPEDRELGVSAFGFAAGVPQGDERRERADTGTVRGL
jgi:hypothetical protein